ncbi:MAG: RNA 2',3'-cyclic phosphodiesterase [Rhodospirillales bacterium]|nr:RNA 2',3'-cyclic phosphodiesterase [Rhodospirillales bacterium]MCB9997283.1 RNA 2',3'-cyclic phosphodiesterase [Rhodospirillales bacterium]
MGTVRLFTALPVPEQAKTILDALPRGVLDARWTHPDDLHITLRFLGDVEAAAVPGIIERLDRVRRSSFHVTLSGLGFFNTAHQTVLWAGVGSTRKITALCAEINEQLEPLGFDMPHKPYIPHMTVARLNKNRSVEQYCAVHENKVRLDWRASVFHLYCSGDMNENAGRYRVLQSYALG